MPKKSLNNYIRTYRRRAGLSQDEVAFLLGGENGATISRHEYGKRLPPLDTALGYGVIFDVSVAELFRGEYEIITQAISERARQFVKRLEEARPHPRNNKKLELVAPLASEQLADTHIIPLCNNEYEH